MAIATRSPVRARDARQFPRAPSPSHRPNPRATAWAEKGLTSIVFPAWHDMSRWSSRKKFLATLGRLDDAMDYTSLPTGLQSLAMANWLGVTSSGTTLSQSSLEKAVRGVDICGSPGEANESGWRMTRCESCKEKTWRDDV